MPDRVYVHVELDGATRLVGTTFINERRTLTSDFRYDQSYLADSRAYALAPSMPLSGAPFNVTGLPGPFQDAAPDRWGRRLIGEAVRAETGRPATEVDYLLGVGDKARQGALRFATDDGEFLAPRQDIPRLVQLEHLLRLSERVDRYGQADDMEAVKELLDAGTGTLGGARPKALIREGDRLIIAKFPHANDRWDVMAWEKTALDLAEHAGIPVPISELRFLDGRGVLLLDRFDRVGDRRIGYISGMTMIGGKDGAVHDYEDLAYELASAAENVNQTLEQLFRRIAFSVAIHNTDDHMRNHGFLRGKRGWRFSPAFDINPNPQSGDRATAIAGVRRAEDEPEALMEIADACRIKDRDRARLIIREVLDATASWRELARRNGIAESGLSQFESAFDGLRAELSSLLSL